MHESHSRTATRTLCVFRTMCGLFGFSYTVYGGEYHTPLGRFSMLDTSTVGIVSLTRVTKKLPFGSGDYPDKLLFHQALNEVSNSSDRELPRDMFRFKTV